MHGQRPTAATDVSLVNSLIWGYGGGGGGVVACDGADVREVTSCNEATASTAAATAKIATATTTQHDSSGNPTLVTQRTCGSSHWTMAVTLPPNDQLKVTSLRRRRGHTTPPSLITVIIVRYCMCRA